MESNWLYCEAKGHQRHILLCEVKGCPLKKGPCLHYTKRKIDEALRKNKERQDHHREEVTVGTDHPL